MDYKLMMYLLGFFGGIISFLPFKTIQKGTPNKQYKVSIIIPARNEEKNLPNLLDSLKSQTYKSFEIIVVDDESSDKTIDIAKSYNTKLVEIKEKKNDFVGKPYACLKGYEASSGDILLFLDADVHLKSDTLENLIYTYEKENCTISVWPYHRIENFYENFSFMFNFIGAIPLNNSSILNRFLPPQGLFGPCIVIDRETYENTGGHKNVLKEVVEDIALGKVLSKKKLKIRNLLGYKDLSFRMYSGGLKELFLGWSKSFSRGAISIQPLSFIIIFIFITSTFSVIFNLRIYFLFYIIFAIEFILFGSILGNFNPILLALYPVHLFVFFFIFLNSILQSFIKKEVEWKGRKIKVR